MVEGLFVTVARITLTHRDSRELKMSHPALTLTEPLDGYFPDPLLALWQWWMVAAYTEGWPTGALGWVILNGSP